MKLKAITLIMLSALSVAAIASTTTTNTKTTTAPKIAKTIKFNLKNPKPPLNKYGAVDVNANVPYNVQVPPSIANKPQTKIKALAANWPNQVPPQPVLNVKSYILIAAKTGKVLAAYNANKPLPPASLTKLMLLYIVEQQLADNTLQLQQNLTVPTVAWATGGSRMFLKPKSEVSVRNLISGVIVDSGNDAAVTLATSIAGTQSAFTQMMNQQAKKLQMNNTHFTDIMGLPAPMHYSSSNDMAKLARAIVNQFPQYIPWFKQKWFSYNGIKQPNFNKLLFIYKYADGMKTGSTKEAGYSLVSTAKMPNNNMRLVAVVMGAPNANASAIDSKALLSYGFRYFTTQTIYTKQQKLAESKVYMGATKKFPVGTINALTLTYPKAIAGQIKAKLVLQSPIKAPLAQGSKVGSIKVSYKNTTLDTVPAYALNAVKKGNLWQRMTGRFSLMTANKSKG